MFDYRPIDVLPAVACPIVALLAMDDEEGSRQAAFETVQRSLVAANRPRVQAWRFPELGHNLMRYRPAEVTAAILTVAGGATAARQGAHEG
jgi:pimeloyl-ACP methyl ester carboxylesterase